MQNELHKEAERRKGMRQKRVNFIANIVEKAKSENKRTYGVIVKLVKESKSLYPDLTDHTVQNEFRRRKRQKKVHTTVDVLPSATTNNPPVANIDALMPSTSIDKPTTGQLHSSDTGLIVDPSPDNPTQIECNTTTGFSAYVLDSIVAANDLKASRDRSQKKREESKLEDVTHSQIKEMLKPTSASNLHLSGRHVCVKMYCRSLRKNLIKQSTM